MPSHNHITFMGHLTRSPELRYTPSGTPVASVGMASNRKWKKDGELQEEVCFVDVVAFGKTAEGIAQWMDKGDCMLIEGRLQQRRWETEDGQKRSKHELVAERWTIISTKKNRQADPAGGQPEEPGYEFDERG